MCACANKGEKFLGLNSPLLLCFVFGGDNPLNSCFDELFCDDSNPSSLVPNPLKSRVLTNWSFYVLEKTPIHFDLPPSSQDPLIFWERSFGDMFTG